MTESEQDLISRSIVGDREAVTELIRQHANALQRRLSGKIDAKWQSVLSVDDVMQETFADVILCISQFEPRGEDSFLHWMTTIAMNNLRQAVRGLETAKRGGNRNRVVSEEESYVCLFDQMGGTTTSPSGHATFAEARSALDSALAKMPEDYRTVISLYDLGGCSAEDVSEACGCSKGAMYMRRNRAHEMLRKLIGSAPNL